MLLHMVSPEVSKITNSLNNFGVNLMNVSNMNLQMSLQKLAYWTPSFVVVENSRHSNPRSSPKLFPLKGVLHNSSGFAWRFLNFKYWTNEVAIYVFSKVFESCINKIV